MRQIALPQFDLKKIIDDCISNYRDPRLIKKFVESTQYIIVYTRLYSLKARKNELCHFSKHDIVDKLRKDEMVSLYTNKFVPNGGPSTEKYYDKIKASAPNGICPYCDVIPVMSVDHYLEKADFPTFAVSPNNLVPACLQCNRTKQDYKEDELHLHPYFDKIEEITWLKATITNDQYMIFDFTLDPCTTLNEELKEKVVNHLKIFKLNTMYGILATQALKDNKFNYQFTYDTIGIEGLRINIQSQYNTYKASNRNSWQTAFYKCLMDSDWFLETGYSFI